MRVLLLSFYYPPDLSAGSFRCASLVAALEHEKVGELDVITTMPNRYASHRESAEAFEDLGTGTRVHRIPVRPHKGGMLDQSRSFLDYARGVMRVTRGRKWDIVVATSSRLMTAALGAWVSRRVEGRLYLDIRDLFTDTMQDVLREHPLRFVLPAFIALERYALGAADRINLVSKGFVGHVLAIRPAAKLSIHTNGIDEEFLNAIFSCVCDSGSELPLIVYAGNFGEGQGLHHFLPAAAKALEGRARFRLIGDGGKRAALITALDDAGVSNVEVLEPVPRGRLIAHYTEASILFLHLNDHAAFEKVLPSKIFEYAATGRPILAGVSGYAAEFLREEVPGVALFKPCDADGFVAAFEELAEWAGVSDRTGFCQRYARRRIMDEMAKDILSLGSEIK